MTAADVVMTKTDKGEKYILETARITIIAYHYAWHTRYFIKRPFETRFKQAKAGYLWENYPVTFSMIRDAVGLRNYRC